MITWSCVLQFEVLIRKLPSVDGFSSSSIVVGEVSTLKKHMISWILRYSSTQGSRWDSEVIPGTWTEGSPCGKLIPCNRNRVLLCTELGSSLKGGVGQNQCTSLTRYNIHHFNQIIWIRFCQIVYPCNVQNRWQKWSTYYIHTYWIPSKRTGLHGTK